MINRGKNSTDHEQPIMKSNIPGFFYGVKIGLLFGFSDIELTILNQSATYDAKRAIIISPGIETSLVIRKTYHSKLGHPYSNCKTGYTFDLGPDDHYNRSEYPYYQSECFFLCKYQKFYEAINKTEEYFRNFQ